MTPDWPVAFKNSLIFRYFWGSPRYFSQRIKMRLIIISFFLFMKDYFIHLTA